METESNSLLAFLLPTCRNLFPYRTMTGVDSLCREQQRDLQCKCKLQHKCSLSHLSGFGLWLIKKLYLFPLAKVTVHWLGEEELVVCIFRTNLMNKLLDHSRKLIYKEQ